MVRYEYYFYLFIFAWKVKSIVVTCKLGPGQKQPQYTAKTTALWKHLHRQHANLKLAMNSDVKAEWMPNQAQLPKLDLQQVMKAVMNSEPLSNLASISICTYTCRIAVVIILKSL